MAEEKKQEQVVEQPKGKKEKKAKEAKPPKVKLASQNGISRPKPDTKTGRIWVIADAVSAKEGKPATRAAVLEAAKAEGINDATSATQYGRWRKFHGLKAEPKPAEPKQPEAEKKSA